MRPTSARVFLAALAMYSSWSVSAHQEPSPAAALEQAAARWQARKPGSYEFTIEVRCFCPGSATKTPPRFRVTGADSPTSTELEPFAQKFFSSFNTVEKLFEAIRRSIAFGQFKVAVRYDVDLGYPLIADIDPREQTADDELYFRVTDFRVK